MCEREKPFFENFKEYETLKLSTARHLFELQSYYFYIISSIIYLLVVDVINNFLHN